MLGRNLPLIICSLVEARAILGPVTLGYAWGESTIKDLWSQCAPTPDSGPGKPEKQANGRGDIDLVGYIRVLHENGYSGPLDLEIIGAKAYSVEQCCTIAAESRGHMQACLQACGAR